VSGLEQEIAKLKGELAAAREEGQRSTTVKAPEPPPALPPPAPAALGSQPTLRQEGQRQLTQMDELLRRPGHDLEAFVPEVNATVEKYVANKRAQQETINEYLDCIEDILSPGAPMQVAFSSDGLDSLREPVSSPASAESLSNCAASLLSSPSKMLAAMPSGAAPGPLALALSTPAVGALRNVVSSDAASAAARAAAGDATAATGEGGDRAAGGGSAAAASAASAPVAPAADSSAAAKTEIKPEVNSEAAKTSELKRSCDSAESGAAAAGETSNGGAGDEASGKRQRRDSVGSQLLETLSLELGLTRAQVDALSGQKGGIHSDREIKGKCLSLIKDLRNRIAEHIATSQSITDRLRRILTPVQVAKFLMWVEKNQRSMDLLNSMLNSVDAA